MIKRNIGPTSLSRYITIPVARYTVQGHSPSPPFSNGTVPDVSHRRRLDPPLPNTYSFSPPLIAISDSHLNKLTIHATTSSPHSPAGRYFRMARARRMPAS